jgi:hypothetical protein
MWEGLHAQFLDHLDEVNAELKKVGVQEVNAKAT